LSPLGGGRGRMLPKTLKTAAQKINIEVLEV